MKLNDFHIQIATAYPGLSEEPSRKRRTFLADIRTSEGIVLRAYVKLLPIEDIAKEALCAVLARVLHLPVLRPYYVLVDPSYVEGYKLGNVQHVAFGLEKEGIQTFRVRGPIEDEVLHWPEVVRCAVFDEWIGNNDRYPNNLEYAGNRDFVIFDHDEALPREMTATSSGGSNLLDMLAKQSRGQELELHRLHKKMMGFVEDFKRIDWSDILELLLPEHVHGIEVHFAKYMHILSVRTSKMDAIVAQRLGIRQIDWVSAITNSKSEKM